MNQATDIAFYAFAVAGILVMTRPGSQGSSLVRAIGGSLTGLVQASSGQRVTAR